MFRILQGFSVMILLIAVVGVFNNFVVSFLARRRSMAVLFSVGMSRRQGAGTLLIEAGSGGLIGEATGILAGFLLLRTVPSVLQAVNLSIIPRYSWQVFLLCLGAGVMISLLASASPVLRSSRLDIIQEIRYE